MNGSSWVASTDAWGDSPACWQPSALRVPVGAVAASLTVDAAAAESALCLPSGGQALRLTPETAAAHGAATVPTGSTGAGWASGTAAVTAHCLPATDTVDVPLGVRPWAVLPTAAPHAGTVATALYPGAGGARVTSRAVVAAAPCAMLSPNGKGQGQVAGAAGLGNAGLVSNQAGIQTALTAPVGTMTLRLQIVPVAEGGDLLPCWRFLAPRQAGVGVDTPTTRGVSSAAGIARSTVLAMPLDRALTRQAPVTTSIRFDAALAFERK